MEVVLTVNFFGLQLIDPHLSFRLTETIPLAQLPLNSTDVVLLTLQGLAQFLLYLESFSTHFPFLRN